MNIVIYGYYGQLNTGDELILEALAGFLQELAATHDVTTYVLPCLEADDQYSPRAGGLRLARYMRSKTLARLGIFSGISRTDLLIIGGGGLVQDHEDAGTGPIRTLLKRAVLVRLLRGRVAMLAVGVSPLATRSGRFQTRLLCWLCDLVTTRDTESAQVLATIGVPKRKVSTTGDLALLWRPLDGVKPRQNRREPRKRHLVVSVLPYHRECKENQDKTDSVRAGFATALDRFLDDGDGTITFLSFQGKPQGYDQEEAEAILSLMGSKRFCNVKPYDLDTSNVYQEILDADLLVGMRLHSIVLSYLAAVPFIAVSYHPKVTGFVRLTGMPDRLITREEVSAGELIAKLQAIRKVNTNGEINERLAALQRAAWSNFAALEKYYFHA